MHYAVNLNNFGMVKMLDDFGADATIKNDEGKCSIEIAEEYADEMKEIITHFMS